MRLPRLSGLLFLLLVGCASDSARSYAGGRETGVDEPVGTSLLVRGGAKEDAWAVFLPVEIQAPGIEGWSTEELRAAGHRIDTVEFEDVIESVRSQDSGREADEFLMRRPPRRSGAGGPPGSRRPPLLNPRPTPQQRMEAQRRAADLAAVEAARKLYYARLADAKALYANSSGYQDHHLIPVYLGGSRTGVTYRIPTAYHKLITRAFRQEWGYDKRRLPSAEERLHILLKVYSQYPIPQLIGINP